MVARPREGHGAVMCHVPEIHVGGAKNPLNAAKHRQSNTRFCNVHGTDGGARWRKHWAQVKAQGGASFGI